MKFKALLIAAGLGMSLLGLTSCGQVDGCTYPYPETSVLFDDFHITKTIYSQGTMRLYYRGVQFKDNPIRCYDTNFEDLGDQFDYTFRNGVLTVQADFAEKISGLTIEDRAHDIIYRLRYLDSPQFAWLADVFWYDEGWSETGDREAYYSAAELQAEADRKAESQKEAQESGMNCCTMWWNNETQEWYSWSIFAESAFRTKSFDFVCDADCVYDEITEKAEKLITIILVNSDHTAADMRILYDSEENVIKDTDAIYHKQ